MRHGAAQFKVKRPERSLLMPSVLTSKLTTILVVEPDQTVAFGVKAMLEDRYVLAFATSGRDAMARLVEVEPGLVLLDLVVPDMSGLALCREIRARAATPLIAVSANGSEAEAIASFQAGADGYITKPYRWHELIARIGAALRRSPQRPMLDRPVLAIGDVALDVDRHEVRVRGRLVEFPLREFQLLEVLLSSAGKTFTREALMHRIWGETPPSGTKSVDVHVKRIRARIEDDPSVPTRIITVRGIGYLYAAPPGDRRPEVT